MDNRPDGEATGGSASPQHEGSGDESYSAYATGARDAGGADLTERDPNAYDQARPTSRPGSVREQGRPIRGTGPAGPRAAARTRRGASRIGRAAILVFAAFVALSVAAFVFVVGTFLALSQSPSLPDPHSIETAPLAETVLLDRTGKTVLARIGDVHRENVQFAELPPVLVDATTAIEDKTFWTNAGFDPLAIASAAIDTLRGSARGASTITQQLVRERLLDPALVQDPSRRVERKIEELIQSIRLTQALSKQDIITAYLNTNYYGNNDYGVKAAARDYFGLTDLSKLTLAQAAVLAGIPQSPVAYDLVRNAVEQTDGTLVVPQDSAIVQRRNFILDLMSQGRTPLSGDRYSAADFAAAKNEPVVIAPQKATPWIAPHFIWAVRDELAARLCGTGNSTCPALERGGYQVITTLDTKLQAIAEKWVKAAAIVPHAKDPKAAAAALGLTYQPWMQNLRSKDINNGALVALDYQTGEIVAYVGSADYYAAHATKQFQPKFDVLADGWRQPGSAFKPFNYVTGIDDHTLTASTMLMDVTTDFGGGYTPTDADLLERGPVRVQDALRFSLNIPSVKAAEVNGPDHVFATAQKFGLRFQTATTNAGLSIGLGTEELHPVDLVTGYGTMANGGSYIPHTTILRIVDGNGSDVVPPYQPPAGQQAVSPQAAYVITDILAGNTDPTINPFWGKFELKSSGGQRRPATLKTGTNNDTRDLTAAGYIAPPDPTGRQAGEYALAAVAWNGNSDNSVVSTPGNPVFSIDVTTYVWQGFMAEATQSWPVQDFQQPSGLVQKAVDPWTGLLPGRNGKSVQALFIAGTEPTASVPEVSAALAPSASAPGGSPAESPAGSSAGSAAPTAAGTSAECGSAILGMSFESRYSAWLAADNAWLARAARGPGVAGSNGTRTSYFYQAGFKPYGSSWGPLSGLGCLRPTPSPSATPTLGPCATDQGLSSSSPAPGESGASPATSATPCIPASPSASPSESPTVSPAPTESPPATTSPPTQPPTPPPSAPSPSTSAGAVATPAPSGGP